MNDILIGTSGYDYPEWKGIFYPRDLRRKDFLLYYSSIFNALEINSTFYNMPTAQRLVNFYQRSEGRLSFSIKANCLLTHEITSAWEDAAQEFKNALKPLLEKDKLSALLFQLPQSFHYTPENRIYLAKLLEKFQDFPNIVEFRHKEWIKESVLQGLEQRNAGIVFCDMPNLKNLPQGSQTEKSFIGQNAYIRLHGRNAAAWYVHAPENNGSQRYSYDYSQEELTRFIPIIKQADREGKKVQIYFNNHPNGSGAKNAVMLKELLGIK